MHSANSVTIQLCYQCGYGVSDTRAFVRACGKEKDRGRGKVRVRVREERVRVRIKEKGW